MSKPSIITAARNFVKVVEAARAKRKDFNQSISTSEEQHAYLHLMRIVEQAKGEHICSCGLRVNDTHPKGDF